MKNNCFIRVIAVMLSFVLVTGGLCFEAFAGHPSPEPEPDQPPLAVAYVDANGVAQTPKDCRPVTANMSDGWYALTEETGVSDRVEISGDVNLILCDGKTLKASMGIHVPEGASLTVWGQSVYTENSNTGKLVSIGYNDLAGIGPVNGQKGGTVVINGGNIESRSDRKENPNSPGIGGSVIEINGGKVQAEAAYAAAIGAWREGNCGDITINGGEVYAGSYESSAGIGLGSEGKSGGSVTINGGNVTVNGCQSGAGIGGGYESHLSSIKITGGTVVAKGWGYGAGIGGGYKGDSGNIIITGGNVTATSKYGAAAIGGGYDTNWNGNITISGNAVVNATNEGTGAGIGGGECGNACGNITIDGDAIVTATAMSKGAGIGSGRAGVQQGNLSGSFFRIKGNATVTAKGTDGGAGIGGGVGGNAKNGHIHISENAHVYAYGGERAAGIGGGVEVNALIAFLVPINDLGGEGCDDVKIDGNATVFAQSGEGSCSAIGHGENDGNMGSITFGKGLSVKAGNDLDGIEGNYEDIFSEGLREAACHWRHKALIQPCDHPGDIKFVHIESSEHLRDNCPYCGKLFMGEPHTYDDESHICTSCGYLYDGELVNISFDSNGGSGTMEDLTYMPEGFYTPPECGFTPPAGKSFRGWLVSATGTGALDPVSGLHFPGETFLLPGGGDVVLKAQWEGDSTVTFSPGEGSGEMDEVKLSRGEKYPLPTPEAYSAPDWHSFAGWQVSGNAVELKQPLDSITIEGDTVITAIWERPTHTVTFDSNGGSTVPAQTVQNGEYVTKPDDPTLNNDTFLGWYFEDEVFDFTCRVKGDVTLTARWMGAWERLRRQIDNALPGDTVKLTENVTADSDDVPLLIGSGKSIVLDLNGYSIDRALTEIQPAGNVITVSGNLTLTDSSSEKTGLITGGNNYYGGGGIIVSENGKLTLNGGTISGNSAGNIGGGIFNEGELTMSGGTICNNSAGYHGGGVYDLGTFYLSGNPKITGNKAKGTDDNLCLYVDRIGFTGSLTSGALLGVNMDDPDIFTIGYIYHNAGAAPSEYFSSDRAGYAVTFTEDGNEVRLTTAKPKSKGLTYSGSAQELVIDDHTSRGTMQYQLGEDAATEPTGSWLTTVPKGTDAKDYYVWYRCYIDDSNIGAAGCVFASIAPASITDAVVNLSATSLDYTGSQQSVVVTSVKLGDKALTADTDYEVTGSTSGKARAVYTVTVKGKGNYKDEATANWSIGLTIPTIETLPTASPITYGQKLEDSSLTGGVAKSGGRTVSGSFVWKNKAIKPSVSDNEVTGYEVVFEPTDSDNYATAECRVKLTVNKAKAVSASVTANNRDYDGSNKVLVTVDDTKLKGGEMQYVLGNNETTAPSTGWSSSIPSKADAGTYYVWYKVIPDDNHIGTEPACVKVTINKKSDTDPVIVPDPVAPGPVNPGPEPVVPVTPEKMASHIFSASAKCKGEVISATVSACYLDTVTYTGKKIDPKNDLKMKLDLSPLVQAAGGDATLTVRADEIITVSYVQKNCVNANSGTSKKATIYPKLKLSKGGKSLLAKEQKSRLNKLIKGFNKAAKKNKITYTINPLSLKTCKVQVVVKKTKDGKLKIKNGMLKGIKKVTALREGDTKPLKLKKKMYSIRVVDAEKGILKVEGFKNFCDDAEVVAE